MNRSQITVVLVITALFLSIQPVANGAEKYQQIFIPVPSPETIASLQEIGVDLECGSKFIKGEGLELVVDELELDQIKNLGIPHTVTIDDLGAYSSKVCENNLLNIPQWTDDDPVHMKYGSMGGFYNFAEIVADLDSMNLLYPDICAEKVVIGSGWEENPIYMVKISDNVNINEAEPEGLFDALHHAREPGSYTCVLYAMWYLLENYGTDPEVTYLVDNREFYFVPVVNPDGLLYNEFTNPNGGGYWRKNRRDNGGGVYGVDLNRNYPYQWGYDNQGSSPTPSSSTYRGPAPGSEPETQTMMDFIGQHEIITAMTVHTAAGKYLTAYGYDYVPPDPYDLHMDYLAYAAAENGYTYGYCRQIMYASNGRTQDWQLHEQNIINVEPEVGENGFWPSIQYIMPEAADQLRCHLNMFWCAGAQVNYSSTEVADGYLTPGETEELIVEVFNRGRGIADPVTIELTTIDPYVTLSTAITTTGSIASWSAASNASDPFVADVASGCPIGHEVDFTLTIDQDGYISTEVFSLIVGTPTVFFADNAESGMGNWTVSSSWGLDNDNPHGGSYSFSDSPGGNYTNNRTAVMTLSQPVNLSDATSVWLDLWARWDIESNYDFCQIEVSTNGSSWTPVAGQYTVAGSGIGVQPNGQPGYEGTQVAWAHEFIDLNAYAGGSYFKFRFEFKSDGGVVGDGFFADDVQLLGFTDQPPPENVTVDLTYLYGSPVPIGGGYIGLDIALENLETQSVNFDLWVAIEYEGGAPTTIAQRNLTFPAGHTIYRPAMNWPIPASWAAGEYMFWGRVGNHPSQIWDESGFPFTKDGVTGIPNFVPFLSSNYPNPLDEIDNPGSVSNRPDEFMLVEIHPNPFNPTTVLSYQLQAASRVNLAVYDISGRKVAELVEGYRDAGIHEVTFDASNLASGVYIYRFEAGNFNANGKMVLMK